MDTPANPNARDDGEAAKASETTKINYLQLFRPSAAHHETIDEPPPRSRHTLMAASIALTAVFGGLAGAAAIIAMRSDAPAPEATAAIRTNEALRASVTRLESEISTLRSGIASAQRSTGSQLGKLTERIDRADKAQAEPAAKLAKLTETIERLERRIPQPQQAAAASSDVTGSVPAAKPEAKVEAKPAAKPEAKQEAKLDAKPEAKLEAKPEPKPEPKPQIAEGWRLLDVYGGRAVVESRSGRAYEITTGSNLPGLGRVDAIKRENGHVVVVTKNGTISAAIETRRRAPYYDDD